MNGRAASWIEDPSTVVDRRQAGRDRVAAALSAEHRPPAKAGRNRPANELPGLVLSSSATTTTRRSSAGQRQGPIDSRPGPVARRDRSRAYRTPSGWSGRPRRESRRADPRRSWRHGEPSPVTLERGWAKTIRPAAVWRTRETITVTVEPTAGARSRRRPWCRLPGSRRPGRPPCPPGSPSD